MYDVKDNPLENHYNYLIVGSGLAGSTFAYEASKRGKKVLVVEKRPQVGGNMFNERREGINVHSFGCHIFHCNDDATWNYINQFAQFNNYSHTIKAKVGKCLYSFPINLSTLHQIYGVNTPKEAKDLLDKLKINKEVNNFEDWVQSQIGNQLYEMFYKGYTTKQWGKDPKEIPAKVAQRLPIRTNFNDNYYNHKYQGIPIGGYNQIFDKMLAGIPVMTNFDFNAIKHDWKKYADKLIFTGAIDDLFDYRFGVLEYRSLSWQHEVHQGDYQGTSVVNYCDLEVPYTRIIEHKHFEFNNSDLTIISKEYPEKFDKSKERFYPVDDNQNRSIYSKYEALAKEQGIVLLGRLARFLYYDMNQIISSVLTFCKKEFGV